MARDGRIGAREYEVVLIEGDGVGPEISRAVCNVLAAARAPIRWNVQLAGLRAVEQTGDALPTKTLKEIKRCGVALKGPLTTLVGEQDDTSKNFRSVNVGLRKSLDLYANV